MVLLIDLNNMHKIIKNSKLLQLYTFTVKDKAIH